MNERSYSGIYSDITDKIINAVEHVSNPKATASILQASKTPKSESNIEGYYGVRPHSNLFKVLLYGDEIELHNRFLKIGQEYGTPAAKAIADLHRHDDVVNDGVNNPGVGINVGINHGDDVINDVINGVIKFTEKEEIAVKALIRDPRLSAAKLADLIGVKQRQAQRIITSLKNKTGLKRRGARKNGEWYFEGVAK